MRHFLGKFCFNLIWLPCRLIFKFFLHYQVKNQEGLKNTKPPLIIAANHVFFMDPFLIGAAFPFNSNVFPIRFATAPKYYWSLLFPFVWLLGTFPIYRKIGLAKSLKVPLKILKQKRTVGIFPQGKVRHLGRPKKHRRGTAYLAIKTRAPILPIKIEGGLNLTLKKFFLRKDRITIVIGEVFSLPQEFNDIENIEQLNHATDFITEKLDDLRI